jgi:hypothetical protein
LGIGTVIGILNSGLPLSRVDLQRAGAAGGERQIPSTAAGAAATASGAASLGPILLAGKDLIVGNFQNIAGNARDSHPYPLPYLKEPRMADYEGFNLPDELYYHPEDHLWARVEDGRVRVGLDAVAQAI